MKILLLNPNTTTALTDIMVSAAREVTGPDTEIIPLTAPRGVPYISTHAEAQLGGGIVLEMLAENHDRADAAIIAAFGDPGLLGARELFDIPIVGLAEGAMLTACMLGRKFSIITFARALGTWYKDCVEMHGLSGRLASIRALDDQFKDVSNVQNEMEHLLVDLTARAIAEDGADVIILGGAPLSGMAWKVADRIQVPVIDQVAAAVKQAEALVALRSRKAQIGSFRRPTQKKTIGISPALARRIEHADI
jgi:Asp/Glu/hydantoin racemase